MTTLQAPGLLRPAAQLLFDQKEMEKIYSTGRGSFKVRCKWRYDKAQNVIEVYEIPYSTTIEAIMDKVVELIKAGKVKEIADMRDETDLNGLKLTIDLKRGVDPDKLMQKLYRLTPLQDSFACNFNILIAGMPRVMGVRRDSGRVDGLAHRVRPPPGLLRHDRRRRRSCHLLQGLKKILLDIDKAIRIIRETEAERRGGSQPDDRLRHRPGAGRVCGGDQTAQHQ